MSTYLFLFFLFNLFHSHLLYCVIYLFILYDTPMTSIYHKQLLFLTVLAKLFFYTHIIIMCPKIAEEFCPCLTLPAPI